MQLKKKLVGLILLMILAIPSFSQDTIFYEGFENVTQNTYTSNTSNIAGLTGWSYSRTSSGQLRFNMGSSFCKQGVKAMTLDASVYNVYSNNDVVKKINLKNYRFSKNITLSFYYMDHGDENQSGYDNVSISTYSGNYKIIYELDPENKTNGTWNYVSIDLDSAIKANNIILDSTLYIKFNQYDNTSTSYTTSMDGITFDEILLTGFPTDGINVSFNKIVSPTIWKAENQKFGIEIINHGDSIINSVSIGYILNNIDTIKIDSISLANFTSGTKQTLYFPDSIKVSYKLNNLRVWVNKPNYVNPDRNIFYDTSYYSFFPVLKGTYYIDSSGKGDFTKIQNAIDTMTSHGICGPTTFIIKNGTYIEDLEFTFVQGVNANSPVTFKGEDREKVILKKITGGNALIHIENLNYFTLENFTLETNRKGIYFWGGHDRKISNCILKTTGIFAFDYLINSSNDEFTEYYDNYQCYNTKIEGNTFINGSYGIYLASDHDGKNWEISNNHFINQSKAGIKLNMVDGTKVLNNYFDLNKNNESKGIWMMHSKYNTISQNNIINCYEGIYFEGTTTRFSTISHISNNMIKSYDNGINLEFTDNVEILNNTISIQSGGINSCAIIFDCTYLTNNVNISNNILSIEDQGYIFKLKIPTSSTLLKNNIYNYPSQNTSYKFYLDNYSLSLDDLSYLSFNEYRQDTNIGYSDSFSKSNINLEFQSNNDLHLDFLNSDLTFCDSSLLNVDIDGDTRYIKSQIGADDLPKNKILYIPVDTFYFGLIPKGLLNSKAFSLLNTDIQDTINLSTVSSSDTNFKLKNSTLSILPLSKLQFDIEITPMTIGHKESTLKIINDNDTSYVLLIADVFEPPLLKPFDTVKIEVTCNEIKEYQFAISNSGNGQLEIKLGEPRYFASYPIDTLNILYYTYGIDSGLNYMMKCYPFDKLKYLFKNYKLSHSKTTSKTVLETQLANKDVLIFAQHYGTSGSGKDTSHYLSFEPVIKSFVENGGTVIYSQTIHKSIINASGLLYSNEYNYCYVPKKESIKHPILDSMPISTCKLLNSFRITTSDAVVLYKGSQNRTPLVYKSYGKGCVVYEAFDFNTPYGIRAFANILKMISGENLNLNWFSDTFNTYTVTANDSMNLVFHTDAYRLEGGAHYCKIPYISNDPLNPEGNIFVKLQINGIPKILIKTDTLFFDTIRYFESKTVDFYINNLGCGNLIIDSVNFSSEGFIIKTIPDTIAPFDSALCSIMVQDTNIRNFLDTLFIYSNDTLTTVFLKGEIIPSPILQFAYDTLVISSTLCNDSFTVAIVVQNNGQKEMLYTIDKKDGGPTYFDNFDNLQPNWRLWSSLGGGLRNAICGVYSNPNSLYYGGQSSRWAYTNEINATNIDTVYYFFKYGSDDFISPYTCSKPTSYSQEVIFMYSDDLGVTWNQLLRHNYDSNKTFNKIKVILPSAAKINNARFRWMQFNSGSGSVWMLDDVCFGNNGAGWVSHLQQTDTIKAYSSDTILISINTSEIDKGNYYYSLPIQSSDGQHDTLVLLLKKFPVKSIAFSDSIFDFGGILKNTEKTDSMYIINNNCQEIIIDTINHIGNIFSALSYGGNLLPGDSIKIFLSFKPNGFGQFTDSIGISFNSLDTFLYLIGEGLESPNIQIDQNQIGFILNACQFQDSVLIPLTVKNTSGSDLIIEEIYDSLFSSNSVIFDDFETSSIKPIWSEVKGDNGYNCGYIGTKALYFDGVFYRHAILKPIDLRDIRDLTFYLKYGDNPSVSSHCHQPSNNEKVFLTYSINSGQTWNPITSFEINSFQSPNMGFVKINFPESAKNVSTILKWEQPSHGTWHEDIWSIDNLKIINGISWVYQRISKDTIPQGDSTILYIWAFPNSNVNGKINGVVRIKSNDQNKPIYTISCEFEMKNYNSIFVDSSHIELDTLYQNKYNTNNHLKISNASCKPIDIISIVNTNSSVSYSKANITLNPSSSHYLNFYILPTSKGVFTDTITLTTIDTTISVILNGVCIQGPNFKFDDTLKRNILNCAFHDTVDIVLKNTGDQGCGYKIVNTTLPTWMKPLKNDGYLKSNDSVSISFIINATNQTFGLHAGNINVNLKNTKFYDISLNYSINISPHINKGIDIIRDTSNCYDSFIFLVPKNGYLDYQWEDTFNIKIFKIDHSGQYKLRLIDVTGCVFYDTINVNLFKTSKTLFSVKNRYLCPNEEFEIKTDSNYTQFNWSTGELSSSITYKNTKFADTTIWIQASINNLCKVSDTISIFSYPKKEILSIKSIYLCPNEEFEIKTDSYFTNFNWSTNDTSSSITYKNTNYIDTTIWIQALDTNLCYTSDTMNFYSYPKVECIITPSHDTSLCPNRKLTLSVDSTFKSIFWNTNDTIYSIDYLNSQYSNALLIATTIDSFGCFDSDSILVLHDNDCVYPGDANADGKVDNQDVLYIGIKYNKTGSNRPDASILWRAEYADFWNDTIVGGVDIKHVDTDGDGIIDNNDTTAISLNYGKTRGFMPNGRSSDPPLFIDLPDTLVPNQKVSVPILFGSSSIQVSDFYGISFEIFDPSGLIKDQKVSFDFNTSWIGDIQTDLLTFYKGYDLCLVRTNHSNQNGFGKIGEISFTVDDAIILDHKQSLSIQNAYAISYKQEEIPLFVEVDSALVTTSVPKYLTKNEMEIHFYPNPTNSTINIELENCLGSEIIIETYNSQGKLIGKNKLLLIAGKTKTSFDLSPYSKGMYLFKIISGEHQYFKKVIKN